jgi:hypothetical protein
MDEDHRSEAKSRQGCDHPPKGLSWQNITEREFSQNVIRTSTPSLEFSRGSCIL